MSSLVQITFFSILLVQKLFLTNLIRIRLLFDCLDNVIQSAPLLSRTWRFSQNQDGAELVLVLRLVQQGRMLGWCRAFRSAFPRCTRFRFRAALRRRSRCSCGTLFFWILLKYKNQTLQTIYKLITTSQLTTIITNYRTSLFFFTHHLS